MAIQAADLYANVGVTGADRSVRDLGRVSNAVDTTQRHLNILGRQSQGIGKGFGQMAGGVAKIAQRTAAAVVVAGVAATAVAVRWQDAFAGVKKTVEGTPQQLDKLNDSLKMLSTRIPVSYTDLAGIAQEAGALDVAAADVDKFTEAVARTTAATVGLDTATAAEAFGKLGTVFSLHGKDYEKLGSVLVELGRNGASTEADIIAVTKRFAAAGQQAHLSASQVLGWSSALASLGPEAEAAGGALQRIFNRAQRNIGLMNEKGLVGDNAKARVKAFARVSGMTVDEFVKEYTDDASGAMQKFIEGLRKLPAKEQQAEMFRAGIINQRDLLAFQSFVERYPVLVKQLGISNKAWKDGTALAAVSATRFDTLKSKLIELKNAALVGADAFGERLLPALTRIAGRGKDMILAHLDDFRRWGDEVAKAIDGIDWNRVERAVASIGEVAVKVLDLVRQVATAFPEATVGFAGLVGIDKLSGGMFGKGAGNIAGGVINQFLARGANPANPLWVATAGGFGGGVGGVGGGGGGLLGTVMKVALIAVAADVAYQLWGIRQGQEAENRAAESSLTAQTDAFAHTATLKEIQASLAGLEATQQHLGGNDFSTEGLAYKLNWDGVKDSLESQIKSLHAAVKDLDSSVQRDADVHAYAANSSNQPGKAKDDLAMTAMNLTSAAKNIYQEAMDARGLTWDHSKKSTQIDSRLKFIRGHADSKGVAVAHDLVTHMERSNRPLYTSNRNQERTLSSLRQLQQRLINHGDMKNAAVVGGYIDRLERRINGGLNDVEKAQLKTKLAAQATTQAVKDKDLSLETNVQIKLDGQKLTSALLKYRTTRAFRDRFV